MSFTDKVQEHASNEVSPVKQQPSTEISEPELTMTLNYFGNINDTMGQMKATVLVGDGKSPSNKTPGMSKVPSM